MLELSKCFFKGFVVVKCGKNEDEDRRFIPTICRNKEWDQKFLIEQMDSLVC